MVVVGGGGGGGGGSGGGGSGRGGGGGGGAEGEDGGHADCDDVCAGDGSMRTVIIPIRLTANGSTQIPELIANMFMLVRQHSSFNLELAF